MCSFIFYYGKGKCYVVVFKESTAGSNFVTARGNTKVLQVLGVKITD